MEQDTVEVAGVSGCAQNEKCNHPYDGMGSWYDATNDSTIAVDDAHRTVLYGNTCKTKITMSGNTDAEPFLG